MTFAIRLARPDEIDEVVRIDDEASELYTQAGIALTLPATHPFAQAERALWLDSARSERLFLAVSADGGALGFAALDRLDDALYLDQLSVRSSAMQRGIGRSLLRHAIAWAANTGAGSLWLTTYDHVPWNRPFYEREGFRLVPESECGPGIRRHLDEQRRWLPLPKQRVAMRRSLAAG